MTETYLQVETTVASRNDAERLAGEMVGRRLAACAQIVGPIKSVYRWDGEIQNEEEYLILFKTRTALAARFKDELLNCHPYDVPEVLLFQIQDGSKSYLEWVSKETMSLQSDHLADDQQGR